MVRFELSTPNFHTIKSILNPSGLTSAFKPAVYFHTIKSILNVNTYKQMKMDLCANFHTIKSILNSGLYSPKPGG